MAVSLSIRGKGPKASEQGYNAHVPALVTPSGELVNKTQADWLFRRKESELEKEFNDNESAAENKEWWNACHN